MSAGRSTRPPYRFAVLLLSGLLVCLLHASSAAAPPPAAAKADEVFQRVEKAWSRGQAKRVTAEMAPRGRIRLQLRDPGRRAGSISGTYRASQAETALADYFEKVPSRRLKARKSTRKKSKTENGYRTRHYDYRYRPKGQSYRSATLVVQLRAGDDTWVLVSITERGRR